MQTVGAQGLIGECQTGFPDGADNNAAWLPLFVNFCQTVRSFNNCEGTMWSFNVGGINSGIVVDCAPRASVTDPRLLIALAV